MNYFWIRVYDYKFERDSHDKGIMLDEFYLKGEDITRDSVKVQIKNKYIGNVSDNISFSKPRKKDGLYAFVMDSNNFFYDRFYLEIDTYCFCCHKEIKGKASEFPKMSLDKNEDIFKEIDLEDEKNTVYFCDYDCKQKLHKNLAFEGDFQEKEVASNGVVFGYIYLMYNRIENKYYIGQTRYLPFFRWQEHIKSGEKGNITDITFSVLTEVRNCRESDNQKNLNNAEAWWISKYKEEGYDIFNVTIPKLTLEDYQNNFNDMVAKKKQLSFV